MQPDSTPPLDAAEARRLLAAAVRAWENDDLDALADTLHPDVRIQFNVAAPIVGIEAARAWLSARFTTQLDYRLTKQLRGIYGRTVVSQWTGTWHEADGRHYHAVGLELLTVDAQARITHWEATMFSEQVVR